MKQEIKARWSPALTWAGSVRVAEKRVPPVPLLIRRRGAWWRPDARGYTGDLAEAGIYSPDYGRSKLAAEGLSVVPATDVIEREIADTEARIRHDNERLAVLRSMLTATPCRC